MPLEELDGRLRNIERLLTVLIAHPSHLPAATLMQSGLYEDIGQALNRMFPSDPGYALWNWRCAGFRKP